MSGSPVSLEVPEKDWWQVRAAGGAGLETQRGVSGSLSVKEEQAMLSVWLWLCAL